MRKPFLLLVGLFALRAAVAVHVGLHTSPVEQDHADSLSTGVTQLERPAPHDEAVAGDSDANSLEFAAGVLAHQIGVF
jgi:hypothetical protein